MAAIDITGQRFGRLVAIERVDRPHMEWRWRLQCDCGGEATTTVSKVRSGYTASCGCLHRERTSANRLSHGESNGGGVKSTTRLYRIWCKMRQRCLNPKATKYHLWGGRGITVCAGWDDYATFRDWSMANGYADNLTIDRIDNDAGYSPDNCRWATYSQQRVNQRRMAA